MSFATSAAVGQPWLRTIVVGLFMVALVQLTSFAVGVGANAGMLIWGAPILIFMPIVGLHFLQPNECRAGWSVFTVWLGSTYASAATTQEILVFVLITALAVAAYYRSSWLFVVAWFGHIAWDFTPRQLPELLVDLPTACMLFDGLIGLYLGWMTWTGRMRAPLS